MRINKDNSKTFINLSKDKKDSSGRSDLGSTIRLEKQGERKAIDLSKSKSGLIDQKIQVTLRWRAAVDLDLHAFGITKTGQINHVHFGNKGNSNELPFMTLDKDAGVGNTAGDNDENLVVHNLDAYSTIVFAANIFRFFTFFSSGDHFGNYDGSVIVNALGQTFEVPLNSTEVGKWILIASIDNSNSKPFIVNINKVITSEPDLIIIQNIDSKIFTVSGSNNSFHDIIQYDKKKSFIQKKIPAGILAIFFGAFGIHKFYLGFSGAGLIMLCITLVSCFILFWPMWLLGFVEGIIYLSRNDDSFYQDYSVSKKNWF